MASELRANIARLASDWPPPSSEDDLEAFGVRVAEEALRGAWHAIRNSRRSERPANVVDELLAGLKEE